ncbi:ASCH domain-containing protein [Mesobacillus zeae]|uniref:ASCH domain-containing protein n=1 Tax=Mesobacillus zeae TaxID=1917180 RepID=UPI0021752C78|nr:ASCH domain-containing protein [Mesobacillus zeae]
MLNRNNNPLAIIRIVDVTIMPMNEVPEDFAAAEGEGDRSYRYWKEEHTRFFSEAFKTNGLIFSEDIKLVCEKFELIHVKKTD